MTSLKYTNILWRNPRRGRTWVKKRSWWVDVRFPASVLQRWLWTCVSSGSERGGQSSGRRVRILSAGWTPREDRKLQAGASGSVPRARRTPEDGQTEETPPAWEHHHQLQHVSHFTSWSSVTDKPISLPHEPELFLSSLMFSGSRRTANVNKFSSYHKISSLDSCVLRDSKIPEPPKGHKWKRVQHDNTVTWLVSWVENIHGRPKYIMLNPSSKLKVRTHSPEHLKHWLLGTCSPRARARACV